MSDYFNPYSQWLGIPEAETPPDHYRLLGLEKYESNRRRINSQAESRFRQIQDIAMGGENVVATQRLLNEISRAKVVLLDEAKRLSYDEKLKSGLAIKPDVKPTSAKVSEPESPPDEHESVETRANVDSPAPYIPSIDPISVQPKKSGKKKASSKKSTEARKKKSALPTIISLTSLSLLTIGAAIWVAFFKDPGNSNPATGSSSSRPAENRPVIFEDNPNIDHIKLPEDLTSGSRSGRPDATRLRSDDESPVATVKVVVEPEMFCRANRLINPKPGKPEPEPVLFVLAGSPEAKRDDAYGLKPGDTITVTWKESSKLPASATKNDRSQSRIIAVGFVEPSESEKKRWITHRARFTLMTRQFGDSKKVAISADKKSSGSANCGPAGPMDANVTLRLTMGADFGKANAAVKYELEVVGNGLDQPFVKSGEFHLGENENRMPIFLCEANVPNVVKGEITFPKR